MERYPTPEQDNHRIGIMRNTWLLELVVCACIVVCAGDAVHGQEPNLHSRLIDSYGRQRGEDASARLDNFAVELGNQPGAAGHLICWGPEGEAAGAAAFCAGGCYQCFDSDMSN